MRGVKCATARGMLLLAITLLAAAVAVGVAALAWERDHG